MHSFENHNKVFSISILFINCFLLEYSRLYRTGDYASVRKGGIIHYEGRTDSQVKIRGHRVDLTEIEKNLLEIPEVEKGIVLCYHAGQMDQAILAFSVISSSSSLHEIQIEKMLLNKLPEYMTPQVIIVEQLPLLVNGKIDRQTLLKMYENANNNSKEIFVKYFSFNFLKKLIKVDFVCILKMIRMYL